ncbi:DUF1853 family protein [Vibrio nitrifigilis]|uniref:DUF1853 family protein n=1 Tax=Vibrio nitrifigilis TaxID=2789781 RepID=A0ABS0GAV0_9VIBR|nr:DUF1853 family protein [Vibrio nitrifigilis]MBF8999523.1 DUF1853 family protein [Vibrio nitrifigilis]
MNLQQLAQWIISTPCLLKGNAPVESHSPFTSNTTMLKNEYTGNRRLGFLYQFLCAELFHQHAKYQDIYEELQINQEGRTLGAVDFVLRTTEGQLEHWEVAVKFYLLHQGYWYGPNAQDRLDLKLNHMLNKQLPFSQSSAFIQAYPEFTDPTQHLLMQGRLYTNPFEPETVPQQCLNITINTDQIQGHWCYQSQQQRITTPLYLLEKHQWLTGADAQSPEYHGDAKGFVHCQDSNGKFWFIVPDSWPTTGNKIN